MSRTLYVVRSDADARRLSSHERDRPLKATARASILVVFQVVGLFASPVEAGLAMS